MVDGHIQTVARRNEAIVLFSLITIDNFTVKTDSEGRLCLNDLHKVAGGEKRHAPAYFIDRVELDELRFELKKANTGIPVVKTTAGRYGGTFVCREIVYAYAMWISPQFHLKVIDAYDRLATQGVAVHEDVALDVLKNPLKYLDALMAQAKEIEKENKRLTSEFSTASCCRR